MPKKSYKRDKYSIMLEGFNPNHDKTFIENSMKTKFVQKELNFTLNYSDPPHNTISKGSGILYTSNNKLAENFKELNG